MQNQQLEIKRPGSVSGGPDQKYTKTCIAGKTGNNDAVLYKDRELENSTNNEENWNPWVGKRIDYLHWDEYFMSLAFLSAQRSKDPSSQVGACIVNDTNKIVGIGYNGMPNGCDDDMLPWARSGDWLDTKYPYVCHAEMNAILNKNSASVHGCTIYVALFPCNECAKLIIQSGIKQVIFYSDKYHADSKMGASRKLLTMAGVSFRQFQPRMKQVVIDFTSIDERRTSI